ncbi:MAG: glycosyltransferase, partial [Erysipelotrichaceae bacterium]|nr:glycosyltransferase [Erysipelotrichaceae bacterium]
MNKFLHRLVIWNDLEVIVQDGDVETDGGQSDALNKGFAKAKGAWLFWLNADDVLLPGALERVFDRIDRIKKVEWIAG